MNEDDLIEMFGLEWGDYVEYLEDECCRVGGLIYQKRPALFVPKVF